MPQINVNRAVYDRLQQAAYRLGFLQSHGQRVGEGSVVKLLGALVASEIDAAQLVAAMTMQEEQDDRVSRTAGSEAPAD